MSAAWKLVPVVPTEEMLKAMRSSSALHLLDAYKSLLAAAPQPPELGGEPEVEYPEFSNQGMGCGLEDRGITDRYVAMRYGWDEALERCAIEVVAPLLAEIERLEKVKEAYADSARGWKQYSDTLKAELTSANADKEAYAQNAIDLRKRVDSQSRLLREFHEVTVGGFLDGDHVLRLRAELEAVLNQAAPAAKDGAQ